MKRWWNRRFPYYRLCSRRWCLRVMTCDYRCAVHQADNLVAASARPTLEHLAQAHALAGFCKHGVGMLDQCDDCCPPERGAS